MISHHHAFLDPSKLVSICSEATDRLEFAQLCTMSQKTVQRHREEAVIFNPDQNAHTALA